MRKLLIIGIIVLSYSLANAQISLEKIWESDSTTLNGPESALYDTWTNSLYVSSMNSGAIVQMDLTGKVTKNDWVSGLTSNKGSAVFNGMFYTAETSGVAVIDFRKASVIKRIPIEGAVMLNDVTVDSKGVVYVSDTRAGKVYRIKNDTASLYAENLAGANGLLAVGDDLYVLASSSIHKVNNKKEVTLVADGFESGLDGIVMVGKNDFILSNFQGILYYLKADGTKQLLLDSRSKKIMANDISYNDQAKTLYVPSFRTNRVIAYSVKGLSANLPLDKIKLPAGFSISVYAEVPGARQMVMSESGTLFVGTQRAGNVYAVKDTDKDNVADKKWTIATGMNNPNGVALKNGNLYVAEISKVTKFSSIESNLDNPGKGDVIYDKFPTEWAHGWKYIAFGPDGKLYVPVGAPFNIGMPKDEYASIFRMNDDGTGVEKFASGVRNTVGFTWDPKTKAMWFTDNGRDMMGDDVPFCELNTAPKAGMHFGYPYFHSGTIKDPEYGKDHQPSEFTAPAQNLGPHVAPLGLKFYTGKMFPSQYKDQIFIAEHGSWNRSKKIGYRVSLVKMEKGKAGGYETFASGWLDDATQSAWGRPVDVLMLADGSMLVSDDVAGVIYRVTYKK
jgi:glucose/arabinose dehydrogenase